MQVLDEAVGSEVKGEVSAGGSRVVSRIWYLLSCFFFVPRVRDVFGLLDCLGRTIRLVFSLFIISSGTANVSLVSLIAIESFSNCGVFGSAAPADSGRAVLLASSLAIISFSMLVASLGSSMAGFAFCGCNASGIGRL